MSEFRVPQLSAEHRWTLEKGSAISPEVIAARGYLTARNADELRGCIIATGGYVHTWHEADDDESDRLMFGVCYDRDWHAGPHGHDRARYKLRLNLPLLHFPSPVLVLPQRWAGKVTGHRFRPDTPAGKMKYVALSGSGNRLDASPAAWPLVTDAGVPLLITEGEKKSDALASAGAAAVTVTGVWNWLTRTDKKAPGVPVAEFGDLPLAGRDVHLAYDSDARGKPNVAMALADLTAFLWTRGAVVWWTLPPAPYKGCDDYLAAGGTLDGLLSGAVRTDGGTLLAADPRSYKVLRERVTWQQADADARQRREEAELAKARGPRVKLNGKEYAEVPQPDSVIDSVLAAEVNLLGGPSGEGKSLLARDWALAVASGKGWRGWPVPVRRNVLWIASEGLHDFRERWTWAEEWEDAADRLFILPDPVSLVSSADVDWLLREYAAERPGLVVFDVIYGMGMADDNGTKDALPVIGAMKKISAAWGAAALALGHPSHGGGRRFRGSSMWRQLAAVEWHMAEGSLTCEKSKIAHAGELSASYLAEYPRLKWLTPMQGAMRYLDRERTVRDDMAAYPDDTDRKRAARLARVLGVSESTVHRIIRNVREAS